VVVAIAFRAGQLGGANQEVRRAVSTSTTPEQATGVGHWVIDRAHSELGFSIRHMMIATVHGRFKEFEGYIDFDPADPSAASGEIDIKVASIDTREEGRNNHLRSADFFDAEKYPEIHFKTTSVQPKSDREFKVTGDLTIRDVTKPVTFDVELAGIITDPYGKTRAGLSATGSINRFDFGLTWNNVIETGALVAGDTVKISVEIEATRAS